MTKLSAMGTALLYSTYLGGSNFDGGSGIAVDGAGQAYVMGSTESTDFPTATPLQATLGGPRDAFVTKLNATGTALLYSTYLGGRGQDDGRSIAVDGAGLAYVMGETYSTNFPTAKPLQATLAGEFDAFVTKLNATGTALLYSTYLGGSREDGGRSIAVDGAGQAYVMGITGSTDFSTATPLQAALAGGFDAFVTTLNATGTALRYSTYLGGSGTDGGDGIAVDVAGNAYVTGGTNSSGFPGTANSSLQNMLRGHNNAFVAKITSSIPFAAFDARAKIDVDDRNPHGGGASYHRSHRDGGEGRDYQRQDDDEFKLEATFTLGGGSNGIDPLKEAVMIQVGTFTTAIPPGSFKQHKGRYVFEGTINDVHLEAVLRSLILGNDYELKVEGRGADLTGTKNPVTVSVTIGDDSGSKEITAKIK